MLKSFALLFTMMVLVSCDSLVQEISPDKIPNSSAKVVVGCFISPNDQFIRARVLTTIPLFGQDNLAATTGIGQVVIKDKDTTYLPSSDELIDAAVEISEGSKKLQLLYAPKEGLYLASTAGFPIIAGKTYTLKTTAKDGRIVTATCTVPRPIRIDAFKRDSVINTFQINGKAYNGFDQVVDVTWQDAPNEKNFYEITGFSELTRTATSGKRTTSYQQIFFNNAGGKGLLYDDKKVDGKKITAPKGIYRSLNWFQSSSTTAVIPVLQKSTLQLSHVDENYLLYRRSIYDARQNNFFTEPTLVYTNIKGGYGCFGAYNTTNMVIYQR